MISEVSKGAYGKVYKGLWNEIPVAIKKYIKPDNFSEEEYLVIMQKEMETLSVMDFPWVI